MTMRTALLNIEVTGKPVTHEGQPSKLGNVEIRIAHALSGRIGTISYSGREGWYSTIEGGDRWSGQHDSSLHDALGAVVKELVRSIETE